MPIDGNIEIDDSQIQALIDKGTNLMPLIEKGMNRLGVMLERQVKKNLSGPILNVQSGRLRSSIGHETEASGDTVTTKVGSNVVYLPVHEFGAIITPKNASHLIIPQSAGSFRRVSQVVIPERRPLRRSWEQVRDSAIQDLKQTIQKGLDDAI